jgi:type IV conjugative transfer system protein TraL
MRQEDKYYVIKTLNNMPRFLFWGMDEFMCLVIPFILGALCGSFLLMISALPIKHAYAQVKKWNPRGTFKHRLYWALPHRFFRSCGFFMNLPPSHKRDFF